MASRWFGSSPASTAPRESSRHHVRLGREIERLQVTLTRRNRDISNLREEKAELIAADQEQRARIGGLLEAKAKLERKAKELDQECEGFFSSNRTLETRFHELVDANKTTKIQLEQAQHARKDLHSRNHELLKAQNKDQKTIEDLKAQIFQYQATISASTRGEDQMADDVIEDMVNQIFFELQNFVVQKFRGVKLDHGALSDDVKLWMREYIPGAEASLASLRIKIIIGIISRTLTEKTVPAFCFGLSDDRHVQAAATLGNLNPDHYPETKQWINLTRKLIANNDDSVLEHADAVLHYTTMREIMENLSTALPIEWTAEVQQELSKIVVSMTELARLLYGQAAHFSIGMVPAYRQGRGHMPFNPEEMEDIGNADDEESNERQVSVSVFPGIIKCGDERGENTETWTVVSKAKVVAVIASPTKG